MVRSRQSVEPLENKATEAADMVRTSNRNIGHDRQRESRVTWVPKYRCGHLHSLCTVPSPKGNSHNKQINKKRQKSDQQQMLFPTGVSFPSDVTHHRTHKSRRSRNRNRPTKQKKKVDIFSVSVQRAEGLITIINLIGSAFFSHLFSFHVCVSCFCPL